MKNLGLANEARAPLARSLLDQLHRCVDPLPLALLVPLFHRLHRLDDYETSKRPSRLVSDARDKEEARNLRVLGSLQPENRLAFAGLLFKPGEFIHPFQGYYSLPGYLDTTVLPYFYRATDTLLRGRTFGGPADFLGFVYMCFLLIHPLPDGNGRVARSLLRYYNSALNLRVKDGDDNWYERSNSNPFIIRHSKRSSAIWNCRH